VLVRGRRMLGKLPHLAGGRGYLARLGRTAQFVAGGPSLEPFSVRLPPVVDVRQFVVIAPGALGRRIHTSHRLLRLRQEAIVRHYKKSRGVKTFFGGLWKKAFVVVTYRPRYTGPVAWPHRLVD
jgi:hypothetical protein